MAKRDDRRWESSAFARFVRRYGVTSLAKKLDIQPPAIYHWIRGSTHPRVEIAHEICRLAAARGMRLSLDKVYGHVRKITKEEPTVTSAATSASICTNLSAPSKN
jgi:DNA-binding XRE family transcriptional regulator